MSAGRVAIRCMLCRAIVAWLSEEKLRWASSFNVLTKNAPSEKLLGMLTDNAAVRCPSCEQAHAGNSQASKG